MAKGSLKVKSDGTLVPDDEARSSLGLGTRDEFDIATVAGQFALLRVSGGDAELIDEPGVVFAGQLDRIGAPDVLSLVHSMGRDGSLTFVFGEHATKTLYLKRGDVVFASSTLKDDRLGESLVRSGKLTRESLQTASMLIGTSVKLGKALVDSKMLSPHELWEGLKYQVEEIILSIFQYTSGSFAFTDGELNLRTEVRLSSPTPHYILEGVARFDELREHFETVSNRAAVFLPAKQRPEDTDQLSGLELDVLKLIDGALTVAEIIGVSAWSDHYTLLALARLYRGKWIRPGAIRETDPREVTPPESIWDETAARAQVDRANVVLQQIYDALVLQEADSALHILNSFFEEVKPGMAALFKDVRFTNSGTLDPDHLVGNVSAAAQPQPDKYLMRGLSDLIGFALFTAGDLLPTPVTEKLVEAVAHWSD